jgi:glycosyltransferase involved in cell wall biosynthesis
MQLRLLYAGQKVARDASLGYPVWRSWFPWENVPYVVQQEKPDLIVVMAIEPVRMALAAKPTGVPVLMQLMDVEFKDHGGDFRKLGPISCIANSTFTATTYRDEYGVEPVVIYPFIAPDRYQTHTTRQNVTFINPVPEKGRDMAIAVARLCPDIPFTFVETWPLSPEQRQTLMRMLAGLPNITLLPPQKDMRSLYGSCRILLAPSLWSEAYGRVATEAQFSGIPVIASNRGGLPEAVGPGGIVINAEAPPDQWAAVLRRVWNDDDLYHQLSVAADAYAHRPEMSYSALLDQMERAFAGAVGHAARP